jgi:hypothetical protein
MNKQGYNVVFHGDRVCPSDALLELLILLRTLPVEVSKRSISNVLKHLEVSTLLIHMIGKSKDITGRWVEGLGYGF